MKNKSRLKNIILSVGLFLITTMLAGYPGHHVQFTAAIVLYSLILYFLLSKAPNRRARAEVLVIFLLPPALFLIPIHIVNFKLTRLSLPSSVAYFIGVFWGYFLYKGSNSYMRTGLSSLLLVLSLWVTTTGYDYWLHYINYGSLFGDTSEKLADVQLLNAKGDTLSKGDFADQILVLDLWNTACGICFRKFPLLESLSKKYTEDTRVGIYAVNIPLPRDTFGMARSMIEQRGYSFDNLYALDPSAKDSFRVQGFPDCLIVLGGDQIVYRGSIEGVNRRLEDLLQN